MLKNTFERLDFYANLLKNSIKEDQKIPEKDIFYHLNIEDIEFAWEDDECVTLIMKAYVSEYNKLANHQSEDVYKPIAELTTSTLEEIWQKFNDFEAFRSARDWLKDIKKRSERWAIREQEKRSNFKTAASILLHLKHQNTIFGRCVPKRLIFDIVEKAVDYPKEKIVKYSNLPNLAVKPK